jgi:hypothetical protein
LTTKSKSKKHVLGWAALEAVERGVLEKHVVPWIDGVTTHEADPKCFCEPRLYYTAPASGNQVWEHWMIQ